MKKETKSSRASKFLWRLLTLMFCFSLFYSHVFSVDTLTSVAGAAYLLRTILFGYSYDSL